MKIVLSSKFEDQNVLHAALYKHAINKTEFEICSVFENSSSVHYAIFFDRNRIPLFRLEVCPRTGLVFFCFSKNNICFVVGKRPLNIVFRDIPNWTLESEEQCSAERDKCCHGV